LLDLSFHSHTRQGIDGAITREKIVHKSRGRYVIVEDSKGGKYVNKVIDAGDIMQVEK
jgi:ribose 5-phosphate isomerase